MSDPLIDHLFDLKTEAMALGRYPANRQAPFWYDVRDQLRRKEGLRAFRCIAYNQRVRLISRIEQVLAFYWAEMKRRGSGGDSSSKEGKS